MCVFFFSFSLRPFKYISPFATAFTIQTVIIVNIMLFFLLSDELHLQHMISLKCIYSSHLLLENNVEKKETKGGLASVYHVRMWIWKKKSLYAYESEAEYRSITWIWNLTTCLYCFNMKISQTNKKKTWIFFFNANHNDQMINDDVTIVQCRLIENEERIFQKIKMFDQM